MILFNLWPFLESEFSYEILKAKEQYSKLMSWGLGIIVQLFLTNNSLPSLPSLDKWFDLQAVGLTITMQSPSGTAEIQTIMTTAITMMLHSLFHLFNVADAYCLWQMAVQYVYSCITTCLMNKPVSCHMIFSSEAIFGVAQVPRSACLGTPGLLSFKISLCMMAWSSHVGSRNYVWPWTWVCQLSTPVWFLWSWTLTVSEYINSKFIFLFDDWLATIAASFESLPNLTFPEWFMMFGDLTFQFPFDDDNDDSNSEEQFSIQIKTLQT